MFKKILFATSADPSSDAAARVAFDMAQRYGGEITVFHVLGTPSRGFSQLVVDVRTGEEVAVDDEYLSWVKEEMKNTYAKQLETCDNYKLESVVGFPHREILRKAREMDADVIVLGSSLGETDDAPDFYRKGFLGSTLRKVAKAAKCPVMVIGRPAASFWGGFSNVVFGTDFSRQAESAFRFAYNAVKDLNGELNLFHALDISGVHAGKVLDQDTIEDRIREARNMIRARYVAQMDPEFKNYGIEVWEGVPYVEIVKFAREKQADLIVMAHHTSEKEAEESEIGSTLEQVIMRAACPVVSVNRPQG